MLSSRIREKLCMIQTTGDMLSINLELCYFNSLFFSSVFLSAETHNLPKQPPLAQAVGQAAQCLAIMARTGIGSCAFASVDDYLH